jgi:hypothetical protein
MAAQIVPSPLELERDFAIMRQPGRGGFPGGVVMGMA